MNTISNNVAVDHTMVDGTARNNPNENINHVAKQIIEQQQSRSANTDEPDSQISVKQLETVAQQLQDFVGGMNKGLEFSVDKDSGRDVIKVIDKANGDLLKQYPTEEVLDLVSKLSEATGALVNEKI